MIDDLLEEIATYVCEQSIESQEAYDTALICLADSLGCALLSLTFPECTKLLGPLFGTTESQGMPLPGTHFILDPIQSAFQLGAMIRWLDYNDTWLAEEWGHPSDNLGGIIAVADSLCRQGTPITVHQLFTAMIKAYEIQGALSLKNSFNRIGLDHVILVKVATAAVTTFLLGGGKTEVISALSNAFIDLGPLRTYRHAPCTGSRKSWAAGDAASRGVFFAYLAMKGEMGYPQALTAKKWGLQDVLFQGKSLFIPEKLGSHVIENILFKVSFPAEFHAQTAVECAVQLHSQIQNKIDMIERIEIETQEPALRIIDKKGPLNNSADRDHCLQYMIAVPLLFGTLSAEHYLDSFAFHPRIDLLREKMIVRENRQFSIDYLDPEKRSIANQITVFFNDGSVMGPVRIEYPIGHKQRRKEAIPLLYEKCKNNLLSALPEKKVASLLKLFKEPKKLSSMKVSELMDLMTS